MSNISNMIESFISLVNSSQASVDKKDSIDQLFIHYDLDKSVVNFSYAGIIKFIKNEVFKNILSSDSTEITRASLYKIRRFYVLNYFNDKREISPYYEILVKLNNITHADMIYFKSFSNEEEWKIAISLLRDLIVLEDVDYKSEISFHIEDYDKENEMVLAAKHFNKLGYETNIDFDGIHLMKDDEFKWIESIDRRIEEVGGENMLYQLFLTLEKAYDQNINRYLVYRNPRSFLNPTKPAIPFGYMINLAVKHISKGKEEVNAETLDSIFDECQKYATLKGLQPYYYMDDTFYNPSNFVQGAVKSILYDSIYLIPQLNFNYLPFLLENVFLGFESSRFKNKYNFSIKEFIDVIKCILQINNKHTIILSIETFPPILSKEILSKIFNSLSRGSTEVNKGYYFPEDAGLLNFLQKPLIRIDQYYYLPNKILCAPAFINCLAGLCFKLYSSKNEKDSFANQLGIAVEKTIQEKLKSKNIPFKTGEYGNPDNTEAQCDIVIEDDTRIVFIETKNKELKLISKSGSDIDIIFDLIYSMVAEMEQTGRHKLNLEKYGKINFDNGDSLILNSREIFRVGITFEDYGSIHSRMEFLALLKNFSISKFRYRDDQKKYLQNRIDTMLEKYQKTLERVMENNAEYYKFNFLDCSFFSIEMLFLMIDKSTSSKTLIDELLLLKNVSFDSKDFYIEYKTFKAMHSDSK